jgi:hypothetical protein
MLSRRREWEAEEPGRCPLCKAQLATPRDLTGNDARERERCPLCGALPREQRELLTGELRASVRCPICNGVEFRWGRLSSSVALWLRLPDAALRLLVSDEGATEARVRHCERCGNLQWFVWPEKKG